MVAVGYTLPCPCRQRDDQDHVRVHQDEAGNVPEAEHVRSGKGDRIRIYCGSCRPRSAVVRDNGHTYMMPEAFLAMSMNMGSTSPMPFMMNWIAMDRTMRPMSLLIAFLPSSLISENSLSEWTITR